MAVGRSHSIGGDPERHHSRIGHHLDWASPLQALVDPVESGPRLPRFVVGLGPNGRLRDRWTARAAAAWITRMGRNMAAKGKKKKAEIVFLVCEETGDYNYTLRRKPGGEKLRLKKYCPRLRKHTMHTEKKK